MQAYLHIFLENAGGDGEAGLAEQVNGVFVKALGLLRRGGFGKVGAAALAGVAVEGELADYQQLRPDVPGGAVKAILLVGENPQVERLVHQIPGVLCRILGGYSQKHHQPRPDTAYLLFVHGYCGPGHPL